MFIRPAIHVIALLALAAPVQAQSACGLRDEIIKVITTKYGEAPRATGIVGQIEIVELFVSQTDSWTIIKTNTMGLTCILATGQDWQDLKPISQGDPT